MQDIKEDKKGVCLKALTPRLGHVHLLGIDPFDQARGQFYGSSGRTENEFKPDNDTSDLFSTPCTVSTCPCQQEGPT